MAPAAAALPLIGKGLAAGGVSFGASKVLGKIFDEDEPEQLATGHQPPPAVFQANPYQPNPYQQMVVPATAGIAGAGSGMITAAPPTTAPATAPAEEVTANEPNKPSFIESVGKTLMAAGAGGITGYMLKNKEVEEDGLEGPAKFAELAKGVLAGAGSGVFTKMGYDAIQEEGGGLKAGLHGGIAGMLASTLKEGGPGLAASFTTAFGAGAVSNLAHDKLEERGSSKLADALAGGGIASSLGYVGLGDGKAAGMMGLGGAATGVGLGALDRAGGLSSMFAEGNPLDKLASLTGENQASRKDDGFELG